MSYGDYLWRKEADGKGNFWKYNIYVEPKPADPKMDTRKVVKFRWDPEKRKLGKVRWCNTPRSLPRSDLLARVLTRKTSEASTRPCACS